MDNLKSFEDALRLAIHEEHKAVDFYLDLATQVVEFKSKIVIEQLARDEMRHKVILTTILENKSFPLMHKTLISLEDKMDASIEIEDSHSDIARIISTAIKKEWDAAKMYRRLAMDTENPEVATLLINMAEEELKHKQSLELELEFYKI